MANTVHFPSARGGKATIVGKMVTPPAGATPPTEGQLWPRTKPSGT